MTEYKTVDGHLFYSDWAFDVNSSVATAANAIAFKSLNGPAIRAARVPYQGKPRTPELCRNGAYL